MRYLSAFCERSILSTFVVYHQYIVVVIPKPRNSIFITQNGYQFYAIAKIEGWNLKFFTET